MDHWHCLYTINLHMNSTHHKTSQTMIICTLAGSDKSQPNAVGANVSERILPPNHLMIPLRLSQLQAGGSALFDNAVAAFPGLDPTRWCLVLYGVLLSCGVEINPGSFMSPPPGLSIFNAELQLGSDFLDICTGSIFILPSHVRINTKQMHSKTKVTPRIIASPRMRKQLLNE